MLADIGIGVVLYALALRWRGPRVGLVAAALFLFLPVLRRLGGATARASRGFRMMCSCPSPIPCRTRRRTPP